MAWLQTAESMAKYETLSPEKFSKILKKIETKMYQHAKNLEFEEAAKLRDQLTSLRQQFLVGQKS